MLHNYLTHNGFPCDRKQSSFEKDVCIVKSPYFTPYYAVLRCNSPRPG